MIICVDFDGTCVKHNFPNIGESIGAEEVLKGLTEQGHKIILYTMRGSKHFANSNDSKILTCQNNPMLEAVMWFQEKKIPLYGINRNPDQLEWTDSPKPYADIYIDDSALNAPVIKDGNSKYIDWIVVKIILKEEYGICLD